MKKIVAKVFTLLFLLTFVAEVTTFVTSENSAFDNSDRIATSKDSAIIFSALFEESETVEEENSESKERAELIFSELFDFSINHFKEEIRAQEKIYRFDMLSRMSPPQTYKQTHALLI